MSQTEKPWHAMEADAAVQYWESDGKKGLTSAVAEAQRGRLGPNSLPTPPKPSAIVQFLSGFKEPLVIALLIAAVVAAVVAMGEDASIAWYARFADPMAILLIVMLNGVLGFLQERRAEAALDALQKMASPSARVFRDGAVTILPAAALVPGDVVELEAGDAVPADLRVLEASDLYAEQSTLNGESEPAEKVRAVLAGDTVLSDRKNMVYMGTIIVRGRGRALVVQTGVFTELGRIGKAVSEAEQEDTPLEQKLDKLSAIILWVCLALSALLFAIGMIRGSQPWTVLLLTAVSLAVAAIPEGLPAITTITLALGMQRMAQRGAIVRKLPAVETLGSATVICSDKTGTLTQNAMTVRILETADRAYAVTGQGYGPEGEIQLDGKKVEVDEGLRRLFVAATICNGARVDVDSDGVKMYGDPTEAALLTAALKGGLTRDQALDGGELVKELPFDSDRKRMTMLIQRGAETTGYTKGSPDVLLPLCTHVLAGGEVVELTDEKRRALLARNEEHASQALRVLGLAERASPDPNDPEVKLCFLGFAAMIDPPRPEVRDAVAIAEKAGLQVVMITGDHKLTAVAIARELGFWHADSIAMTGADLDALDDQKLTGVVHRCAVFARVTAEQKQRIVRAFKRRGAVVAMTGDGVNDAPALSEAQIGVAMGKGGTDVARQAADMVLADDNFATIVSAIREGRAIFRNIQKFIFFLNSANAGLVVAVVVGSFYDWPQLTPLQLLWINLVTNGLPALALGIDPPDAGQMNEPPRPVAAGLLGTREYVNTIVVGIVMGFAALGIYMLPDYAPQLLDAPSREVAFQEARAMAFSLLAISPLFHAFSCRSATDSIFKVGLFSNRFLLGAVAASAAVHLLTIFIPALHPIFKTHLLSGTEWGVVLVLSALPVPVLEVIKLVFPAPKAKPVSASVPESPGAG